MVKDLDVRRPAVRTNHAEGGERILASSLAILKEISFSILLTPHLSLSLAVVIAHHVVQRGVTKRPRQDPATSLQP